MATLTPTVLVEGTLLTSSAATLYTAPGATTATVRSMTLCNRDTSTRRVTLFFVASGGSTGAKSCVYKAQEVLAGETFMDDTLRNLVTGDFISGYADSDGVVSIRVDGATLT